MNNTSSAVLLQENLKKFTHLSPTQKKEFLRAHPDVVIGSLSLATRQVYDYLVRMQGYHSHVYVSHDHIGQIVRKSRRQVIRVLKILREWGLIDWVTPGLSWYKNLANQYILDPIITDLTFRKKAGYWIWGLRILPLVLLTSFSVLSKARSGRDVTSLNNFVFNSRAEAAVESLSTDNSSNQKRESTYRIRYTKVNPGLTKAERRKMHVEQMREKAKLITALKLNAVGQLHFTPYHPEAIIAANKRLQQIPGPIANPIGLLKKLCKDISTEKKLPIDYEYVDTVFRENPSFRDLPVYEDDGRIHRTPVVVDPALLLRVSKPDMRERDDQAQPHYTAPQDRQPSSTGFPQEDGMKRRFVDPYATKYAYLKEIRGSEYPRQEEFDAAAAQLRREKAEGKPLNQFAQYLLALADGTPIFQDAQEQPARNAHQMIAALTGLQIADLIPAPTPSPLPLPTVTDEAPFDPPCYDEDQVWEEI